MEPPIGVVWIHHATSRIIAGPVAVVGGAAVVQNRVPARKITEGSEGSRLEGETVVFLLRVEGAVVRVLTVLRGCCPGPLHGMVGGGPSIVVVGVVAVVIRMEVGLTEVFRWKIVTSIPLLQAVRRSGSGTTTTLVIPGLFVAPTEVKAEIVLPRVWCTLKRSP